MSADASDASVSNLPDGSRIIIRNGYIVAIMPPPDATSGGGDNSAPVHDSTGGIVIGGGGGTGTGGSGGPVGPLSYTHVQSSPESTWTFTHDLPFHPGGVDITDADDPDTSWVIARSYNRATKTFRLTFPKPVRGQVTVS